MNTIINITTLFFTIMLFYFNLELILICIACILKTINSLKYNLIYIIIICLLIPFFCTPFILDIQYIIFTNDLSSNKIILATIYQFIISMVNIIKDKFYNCILKDNN